MSDLIDRQQAIDAIMSEPPDAHYPSWYADILKELPSASTELSNNLPKLDNENGELISRQWLVECVNEGWIKFDTEEDENRFIHLVRDIAPSAEPRKKGKWLLIDAGYYDYVKCSQCGETLVWGKNFCPNCGADMREGEEE